MEPKIGKVTLLLLYEDNTAKVNHSGKKIGATLQESACGGLASTRGQSAGHLESGCCVSDKIKGKGLHGIILKQG